MDLLGVVPADRDIAEQAAEAPVSAILFRATRALASSAKIASKHRREWHHCGFLAAWLRHATSRTADGCKASLRRGFHLFLVLSHVYDADVGHGSLTETWICKHIDPSTTASWS
ncbi:MAG: hypothetical protein WB678_16685 [Stellaceae bacterium]